MQNKHTHEDGTPFTKEEFLQKLKTDKEFNDEFGNKGIDQISELIEQLKDNPDSRRLLISAWAVHDLPKMTLPPCHYGFQVYTRELSLEERLNLVSTIIGEEKIRTNEDNLERVDKLNIPTRAISLMFNMRSNDVPLGLPFNLASYGLLLEILAKQVNMIPDELIANLGDAHIYLNQIDGVKEQLIREPYPLPKLKIIGYPQEYFNPDDERLFDEFEVADFVIENYQSHSTIKIPLSN